MTPRVIYTDLDGTMVGPYGSFFHDAERRTTLEPARALERVHAAGITLVLVSGRGRASLTEAAGIFGAGGFVGEMGALIAWDHGRRLEVCRGAMPVDLAGTPTEVMEAGGVPAKLFEAFPGRLEYHAPWHVDHAADVMLRGNVDIDEAHQLLADWGWSWLRLRDNGVLHRRRLPDFPGLPVHVYHLMPDGISKASGVAADLERRGLTGADAVALGDSVSDLEMAPLVAEFWLTANGAHAPATAAAAAAQPNVRITAGAVGLGRAEAIRSVLGEG
jgi:hydroxymethylpyrimidine pyrophosphatase-like HAD family hydrolase